jgi:hypothetical protein
MNKDIELIIADDKEVIAALDALALGYVKRIYTLLFGFRPLYAFFRLFAKTLPDQKEDGARPL